MNKQASSFSQVETAIVHQMEAESSFHGRGDPNATKAQPLLEVVLLQEVVLVMTEQIILMSAAKAPEEIEKLRESQIKAIGLAMTKLIRVSALIDINPTLALGSVNQHLRF